MAFEMCFGFFARNRFVEKLWNEALQQQQHLFQWLCEYLSAIFTPPAKCSSSLETRIYKVWNVFSVDMRTLLYDRLSVYFPTL